MFIQQIKLSKSIRERERIHYTLIKIAPDIKKIESSSTSEQNLIKIIFNLDEALNFCIIFCILDLYYDRLTNVA